MRWKSSADTSCRRGCATILLMPAALTSTSSRPSERTAVSTRRTQSASRVTSPSIASARCPGALALATSACAAACWLASRWLIATSQPSRTKRRAVAAPMPDAAPLISATRRSFAVAALMVCPFNRSHGGLQKIEQQPVHRSGLLLLHPVAGAIDQLAAEHARAGARLHRLEVAGLLEHAPVAGAGDEQRRHVDRAAREGLQLADARRIG